MSKQEIQDELKSTRFKQRKLIARRIDSELLLYEEETSTAHCLNGIAGEMWMACARKSTAIEVTEALRPRWPDIEEEVVWASLSQMGHAGLLEETTDQEIISISRRELVRKLGFTAAAVLIHAPVAGQRSLDRSHGFLQDRGGTIPQRRKFRMRF